MKLSEPRYHIGPEEARKTHFPTFRSGRWTAMQYKTAPRDRQAPLAPSSHSKAQGILYCFHFPLGHMVKMVGLVCN